ncbi:MAG TPA: hypothetical protein VEJ63_02785 [Planctomycetota bacterium]|nr:hypothetical protein [Planctomycetota bacterium]
MPSATVYKPSQKVGRFPWAIPAIGVAAAVILGILAAAFTGNITFSMKLQILVWAGAGAGIGAIVAGIGTALKCRNRALILISAVAALAVGLHTAYAYLATSYLSQVGVPVPLTTIIFDPTAPYNVLEGLAQSGVFIKNNKPMGSGALWFEWGFAGVMFAGCGIAAAWAVSAGRVFCEPCNVWVPVEPGMRFKTPDEAGLALLKQGDLSPLVRQREAGETSAAIEAPYIRVDYSICKACGNTGVYKLFNVTADKKGEESAKALGPMYVIDENSIVHIGVLTSKEPAPASAAAAEAPPAA